MAKYDPLREHLRASGANRITMTFEQISQLIEREGRGGLPRSAHDYEAFWANEANPKTHVWKIAWRSAGYQVRSVDLIAKVVTFDRR